jgi:HlyD family secretion protein
LKRWIVTAGLGAAALVAAWFLLRPSGSNATDSAYRTGTVDRGSIVASVRATGTLTPMSTVLVGSLLSGQIIEILADYNAPVKAGQIVARLNAEQITARRDAAAADLAQSKADLAVRKAQFDRAKATRARADSTVKDQSAQRERAAAQLAEAKRNYVRQQELTARSVGSQTALEASRTQFEILTAALTSMDAQIGATRAEMFGLDADIALAAAQVQAGEATILGRQAKLTDITIDLERSDIRSPVDGVIVQRQIELGQTVAASLSSPTLFTIAQDLREIDIYANIDEADVGRLKAGQVATFTVNAYPSRTYQGRLEMVRLAAQTLQNVVTYTAVIRVGNSDLSLLPGMTANLQIVTDDRRDVLRVPNAALRFKPAGAAPVALGDAPQRSQLADGGSEGGGQSGGQNAGRALAAYRERIVSEIKPTPEQLAALDAAFAAQRDNARGAFAGLSPDERRSVARGARTELNAKITGIFDAERRTLFETMVKAGGRAAQAEGSPGRVYILDSDSQLKPVMLRLGPTDGAVTQVLGSDLAASQQVVIGGGPKTPPPAPAGSPAPRGPRLF